MDDGREGPGTSGPVSPPAGGPRRIGLVGCVKEKDRVRRRAKDLYTSALFRGRRSYVETHCTEWWILSAKYELIHPDSVIEPYDVALKDLSIAGRREWSRRVCSAIVAHMRPKDGDMFEIHAGGEYRNSGLVVRSRICGCAVENPTEGMRFGEQLRFYQQAQRLYP